jgi:hypothetical protein
MHGNLGYKEQRSNEGDLKLGILIDLIKTCNKQSSYKLNCLDANLEH